ncbi:hypothetical protein [Planctomyces sp. SH-PL14]|uniref:hypothetical protein n=1 Tax=Planctomyces sp. SH-PL14 TaxID=1632864 RepID=UPI00078EDC0B|nr:hypothetical protein [Planctomyces sp. SH-PL14]AMV21238.1 hypothetical protein VT03_25275 [Planctomyces sp. SH-PL14]
MVSWLGVVPPLEIRMAWRFFFVGLVFGLTTALPVDAADPWLAGSSVSAALEEPCLALFNKKPIRLALRDLSGQLRIAMVLDRRCDPNRTVTLADNRLSLKEALAAAAEQSGTAMTTVGSVLYFGPPESAGALRTMAELRRMELTASPPKRRAELARPREVAWADLAEPREVLDRLTRPAGLRVLNPEQLPYDLMAEETLPQSSTVESLTLFCAQFGLGFEWSENAAAIRLVPFPAAATITRPHPVPAARMKEITGQIRSAWPELAVTTTAGKVEFAGRIEQHEQVEEWIRPASKPVRPKPKPVDLSRKRLTFRVAQTPARDVLKALEATGLAFDVAEGIDLDTRLSLELRDATPAEVVEAIAAQLRAVSEIDGTTARLKPEAGTR